MKIPKKYYNPFPRMEGRGRIAWWFLGNLEPRKSKADAIFVAASYAWAIWYGVKIYQDVKEDMREFRGQQRPLQSTSWRGRFREFLEEYDHGLPLHNTYKEMGPSGEYGWRDSDWESSYDAMYDPSDIEIPDTVTHVKFVLRPSARVSGQGLTEPKYDLVYDTADGDSGRFGVVSQAEYDSLHESEFIGIPVAHARHLFQQRVAAMGAPK